MDSLRDKYNSIVVYGCGEYFYRYYNEIKKTINPDYICDRKFSTDNIPEINGIKTITFEELKKLGDLIVVIAVEKNWVLQELKQTFEELSIPSIQANEVLGIPFSKVLSGKDLLDCEGNIWTDESGNEIHFDETISDKVLISIAGKNNKIYIGKNVSVRSKLLIRCGSNSKFEIGDNTEMLGLESHLAESSISIGKDCLFSRNIELRCHDSHQIFSKETGKRINYSKDIEIGDQVWISENVLLLGGAQIGTGSVVGAGCITSGTFDDHVVIAGVPGSVIRKDIIWSKDSTEFLNHDHFSECLDKNASLYI